MRQPQNQQMPVRVLRHHQPACPRGNLIPQNQQMPVRVLRPATSSVVEIVHRLAAQNQQMPVRVLRPVLCRCYLCKSGNGSESTNAREGIKTLHLTLRSAIPD